MDAALAEMAELNAAAGDWKEHLPYQASISYFDDDSVRHRFEAHVDGCDFCQRLLDTLNPSNRVLGELHQAAIETYGRDAGVAVTGHEPQRRVWTVAASLAVVSLVTGFFLGGKSPIWSETSESGTVSITVPSDRSQPFAFENIATLEVSPKVEDQFLAARLYFENNLDALAYRRIGDGLAYAGADASLVQAVSEAPDARGLNAEKLREAQITLAQLLEEKQSQREDYVKVIEASTALGLRQPALAAIDRYLRVDEDGQEIANIFDRVVLRAEPPVANSKKNGE